MQTQEVLGPLPDGRRIRRSWRPHAPLIVAWAVRVSALPAVLDILNPAERHQFASRTLGHVATGMAWAAAISTAGAMPVPARALRQCKRCAWVLTVIAASGR